MNTLTKYVEEIAGTPPPESVIEDVEEAIHEEDEKKTLTFEDAIFEVEMEDDIQDEDIKAATKATAEIVHQAAKLEGIGCGDSPFLLGRTIAVCVAVCASKADMDAFARDVIALASKHVRQAEKK